ncbi:MAG: alpha/beta hydrolase [Clostridia bacterium]|nr:alpha/beta hydrolase [Clostridia bacterium]
MDWYWIVLICFGALALIALAVGYLTFRYAFVADRRVIGKIFRDREKDPSPLVRMRFATKAYMDALEREDWTQTASDGTKLAAWFFPHGGTNKVAVICHGWRSLPWWDFGRAFDIVYNAGYAVLAVCQRAQGDSEGRYMTYGAKESGDLLGWIERLCDRFGGDVRIAIMGVSMGGATVLCATGRELPDAVKCAVSDCSFTSAEDMFRTASRGGLIVARRIEEILMRLFAHVRYADASPIDAVKRSKTPTLFVHGAADDFIPPSMMSELYDACAAPEKAKWLSPGALHAEAAMTNPDEYAEAVLPFLAKHL